MLHRPFRCVIGAREERDASVPISAISQIDSMANKKPKLNPVATSWVAGADDSEFPVQNLPFGIFSHAPSGRDPRIGVAIGTSVVDVKALFAEGLLDDYEHAKVFCEPTLNAFMARPRAEWSKARARLTALLTKGSDSTLEKSATLQSRCMVPLAEVRMHLPATIGDYTDFYSSREHATNVGIMVIANRCPSKKQRCASVPISSLSPYRRHESLSDSTLPGPPVSWQRQCTPAQLVALACWLPWPCLLRCPQVAMRMTYARCMPTYLHAYPCIPTLACLPLHAYLLLFKPNSALVLRRSSSQP